MLNEQIGLVDPFKEAKEKETNIIS